VICAEDLWKVIWDERSATEDTVRDGCEPEADRRQRRAREARLRRLARSRGFELRRQRRREENAYDYGRYRLWSPDGQQIGDDGILVFGLSLDQVEEYVRSSYRP
jgi:hypothetical protein